MEPPLNSVAENASRTLRSRISLRWAAMRMFSLPISVLPVVLATAAVRPPGDWDWYVLIASVLGAVLLHLAGNMLNDYFDFISGVDRKVDGDENRPGRLLVRGLLRPAEVLAQAIICLLAAVPFGGFLLWRCGPGILWFGFAAIVGLYSYTGPPFKLKYRAMGEVLIFLICGPTLMLGAAYAQTGRIDMVVLWLSLPVGMTTTAILVGNNIRDTHEDSTAGIKTLAHVLGGKAMRALYVVLLAGSVLGLAGLAAAGVIPRAIMAAPILLVLLYKPLTHVWRGIRLPDIDARTARFLAALLVLLTATFIVHKGIW